MPELLLQTKLFRPALRSSLINRSALISRLNNGLYETPQGFVAGMTLISAPAGFGKTTLVTAWLAQLIATNSRYTADQIAWLSIDESDNDTVRFLTYLIAALQKIAPQIGETAIQLLQSPQAPSAEAILTILINEISRHDRPLILVLDDYHVITTMAVHKTVVFILKHLPPLLHLTLTTRSDPPLPLSRMRAHNQLTEIRADDLRFTFDETDQFFQEVMRLSLTPAETSALAQLTEGWIAGLQMAGIAMQSSRLRSGNDDLSLFIAAFTGSNRFIFDYLTDEVLERRPGGTKKFLLQTSILDRLCGPLCDAVTGQSDSQAVLKLLEQANLFLIPLDNTRNWYRYHHLFAEVLRRRLFQEQGENLPELHRRAQEWFARNGLISEAVSHAFAGGDFEQAANLIEGAAGDMLRKGSASLLIRWLNALPEETVRDRPRLCLARGWTLQMGPELNLNRAEEWAQLALQVATTRGMLTLDLTGEVAALQAMIAATHSDVMRSRELSRQALEELPAGSPWRGVMTFCLGTAHYLSGEMNAAFQVMGEAVRLGQADGSHFIQLAAAGFLGEILVFQGRLSQAVEMFQQVLAWTEHGIPQKGGVMAHGGLAHILYERNQLDAALVHIKLGVEQIDQVGGVWSAFLNLRVLARVQQTLGNWPEALDALEQAYRLGNNAQLDIIITQTAALRAYLQLVQGNLRAAESWAANCGLAWDDEQAGHPGWREPEYLTLARVLNTQGRPSEALSLLDRLRQSAQSEDLYGNVITILLARALIYQALCKRTDALECLEHALLLAEPEEFCRVFLDEGQPMAALLRQARPYTFFPNYVDKLLAAFSIPESTSVRAEFLPEPLSERELEVLHLIAEGAANKDIAEQLFIAVSTVKKHVGNILVKLDTPNRGQAVVRARELGLLP